jgi:hypothetical protein
LFNEESPIEDSRTRNWLRPGRFEHHILSPHPWQGAQI